MSFGGSHQPGDVAGSRQQTAAAGVVVALRTVPARQIAVSFGEAGEDPEEAGGCSREGEGVRGLVWWRSGRRRSKRWAFQPAATGGIATVLPDFLLPLRLVTTTTTTTTVYFRHHRAQATPRPVSVDESQSIQLVRLPPCVPSYLHPLSLGHLFIYVPAS